MSIDPVTRSTTSLYSTVQPLNNQGKGSGEKDAEVTDSQDTFTLAESAKRGSSKDSGGTRGASGSSPGTTIDYTTATVAELELLASNGDVQAQTELSKRKAADEAGRQAADPAVGSRLHVEA